MRVIIKWRKVQIQTKKEGIITQLHRQRKIYNDAITFKLSNIDKNRFCRDFLIIISVYDKIYSISEISNFRNRIKNNKSPNLINMIDRFREQVLINQSTSSNPLSAFNTFKSEKDEKSQLTKKPAQVTTISPRKPLIYPYSKEHFFPIYTYFNPDNQRDRRVGQGRRFFYPTRYPTQPAPGQGRVTNWIVPSRVTRGQVALPACYSNQL